MRQTTVALVALLLLWPGGSHAAFQEPAQKTTTTESEQPKSEVELALKEAEKRGETVLAACLENCKEDADRDKQEGLERGRALVLPKPVYPAIAAQAHAAGQVQVKVLIGLDGKVIAAAAIEGHPLLQFTSVRAARDATFTPTRINGKPVKVVGVIVYNFVSQ